MISKKTLSGVFFPRKVEDSNEICSNHGRQLVLIGSEKGSLVFKTQVSDLVC